MLTINQLIRYRHEQPPDRQVGVEIEVEGRNLPRAVSNWTTTHDGSLKGEAFEYVLRHPGSLAGVRTALDSLTTAFVESDGEIFDSVRAGVHVHINIQHLTVVQLFNFLTMALIFEPLLAKYCGGSREGNLFCLRSEDAPYILDIMQQVAESGNLMLFNDDDLRYSLINPKAITNHGSVEFRSLQTTQDFDRIFEWCQILLRLKDAALEFHEPREIITGFSGEDSMAFYERVMGDLEGALKFDNTHQLLFQGMRTAQDIAFASPDGFESISNLGANNPFTKVTQKKQGSLLPNTPRKEVKYLSRPKHGLGDGSLPRDESMVEALDRVNRAMEVGARVNIPMPDWGQATVSTDDTTTLRAGVRSRGRR